MAEQTEKAFLKQPKVFLSSKNTGKGKRPGKGGNRFWRNEAVRGESQTRTNQGLSERKKRISKCIKPLKALIRDDPFWNSAEAVVESQTRINQGVSERKQSISKCIQRLKTLIQDDSFWNLAETDPGVFPTRAYQCVFKKKQRICECIRMLEPVEEDSFWNSAAAISGDSQTRINQGVSERKQSISNCIQRLRAIIHDRSFWYSVSEFKEPNPDLVHPLEDDDSDEKALVAKERIKNVAKERIKKAKRACLLAALIKIKKGKKTKKKDAWLTLKYDPGVHGLCDICDRPHFSFLCPFACCPIPPNAHIKDEFFRRCKRCGSEVSPVLYCPRCKGKTSAFATRKHKFQLESSMTSKLAGCRRE